MDALQDYDKLATGDEKTAWIAKMRKHGHHNDN